MEVLRGSDLLDVICDNSFDSVLITDLSGSITYVNAAFTTLTGYAPSEVLGKSPKLLQGVATDSKVLKRLSDAMATGEKFEGKAINYKKDGDPFVMFWRVIPVKVEGVIKAWVAIQRQA